MALVALALSRLPPRTLRARRVTQGSSNSRVAPACAWRALHCPLARLALALQLIACVQSGTLAPSRERPLPLARVLRVRPVRSRPALAQPRALRALLASTRPSLLKAQTRATRVLTTLTALLHPMPKLTVWPTPATPARAQTLPCATLGSTR